jgi:hypothetical protein
MKLCDKCKYAEWELTKAGRLHPSGWGKCTYPYEIPVLPQSMYFVSLPRPHGGYIKRKEQLNDHCVYYQGIQL